MPAAPVVDNLRALNPEPACDLRCVHQIVEVDLLSHGPTVPAKQDSQLGCVHTNAHRGTLRT